MNNFFAIVLVLIMAVSVSCAQENHEEVEKIDVLVFTKTKGFRHESISSGVKCMWELGLKNHWNVTATEDATLFNDEFLSKYEVVVWLNTTMDVLDDDQQEAFVRFYRGGKGYVGIHSAADTEYEWEWYGKMMGGAWFKGHPPTQKATLVIEDTDHPMAWYNEFDGGRSFYTNRGHTPESFDDPELREHFKGGIEWAAGKVK